MPSTGQSRPPPSKAIVPGPGYATFCTLDRIGAVLLLVYCIWAVLGYCIGAQSLDCMGLRCIQYST